jgi:hypothetical protein
VLHLLFNLGKCTGQLRSFKAGTPYLREWFVLSVPHQYGICEGVNELFTPRCRPDEKRAQSRFWYVGRVISLPVHFGRRRTKKILDFRSGSAPFITGYSHARNSQFIRWYYYVIFVFLGLVKYSRRSD